MQSLKMTKIVVILLATIFVVSSFGMVQAGDTFKIQVILSKFLQKAINRLQ